MASPTSYYLIRRREFAASRLAGTWSDPHQICGFTPQREQTYLQNPALVGDDDPVCLLAINDNQVVGRMDLMPGYLGVQGQVQRIVWCSNFYVPPELRGSLAGVMLVLKSQELHSTVGAGGVSQAALPVYQKLKWDQIDMPRVILLRRSRAVVEHFLANPALRAAARFAADAALLAHRGASRLARASANLRPARRAIDRAGDELDRLLVPAAAGRGNIALGGNPQLAPFQRF